MPSKKIPVAVLGATGSVGQRFVQLLQDHPWFEVAELVASERSVGRSYRDATDWRLDSTVPVGVAGKIVKDYSDQIDSPIAFSALPGEVAEEIEQRLAKEGHAVLSNTSFHRMGDDIPLMIPEVNPDHARAIEAQKKNRGWSGYIVTNPNCSAIHMVLTLKPLQEAFGLEQVMVTTLQAVSGAGYPGVPSLDMIDNVVPFISTEEEKMAEETQKLLGKWNDGFRYDPVVVSATCTRVPVRDGHTEAVSVKLGQSASQTMSPRSSAPFRDARSCSIFPVRRNTRLWCAKSGTAHSRISTAMRKKAWHRWWGACANARLWASNTYSWGITRSAARLARVS